MANATTPKTAAKATPKSDGKANAFNLAALANDDNAMHTASGFGQHTGEPSPFQPHVKKSWDDQKAYAFTVPEANEKEVMSSLRTAAYQLGLGIGFDNKKSDRDGFVEVQFKAKEKKILKRRTDAEKLKVIEWARANGRAVHVNNVKVNDDGTIEGRINSNVLKAYDEAMDKLNK